MRNIHTEIYILRNIHTCMGEVTGVLAKGYSLRLNYEGFCFSYYVTWFLDDLIL